MTGRRVHTSAEAHKRTADTAAVSRRIWLFPDNIDYSDRRRLTCYAWVAVYHYAPLFAISLSGLIIEAQSFACRSVHYSCRCVSSVNVVQETLTLDMKEVYGIGVSDVNPRESLGVETGVARLARQCERKAEMKTHFTLMLLLLYLQRQKRIGNYRWSPSVQFW